MRLPPALRKRLSEIKASVQFQLGPPNPESLFSQDLPFDRQACHLFLERLEKCQVYLEWGSGASTLAALKGGTQLVSVESDRRFLEALKAYSLYERAEGQILLHGDIGLTGPWGKPLWPSLKRRRRWSTYPHAPWHFLGESFYADLVLIDGRFRVACALAVIVYQGHMPWTILVDDYIDRPHYQEIEQYAQLVGIHGRMAEFKPMVGIDKGIVAEALRKFSGDWR